QLRSYGEVFRHYGHRLPPTPHVRTSWGRRRLGVGGGRGSGWQAWPWMTTAAGRGSMSRMERHQDEARAAALGRHHEPHGDVGGRLNWLRAGVLGANDGIVSTAGVIVGVAGATTARGGIPPGGLAA